MTTVSGPRLCGVFTALVTPFRDGGLDEPALIGMIERQVRAGVQGLLVGSHAAGEAAMLHPAEASRLIDLCLEAVAGRALVIVDASCNATLGAIARVQRARAAGADAVLLTAPWYNRPSQEGLYRHYQAVCERAGLPVLIGNAPQRTGVDILDLTLGRLALLPNVAGMEEAGADAARIGAIRAACGPKFRILAGRDLAGLGALAHGAHGLMSVAANVAPDGVVAMCEAGLAGDRAGALAWQDRLLGLQSAIARDPGPAAVKLALSRLGLCLPDVRLPMTPCAEDLAAEIAAAVKAAGL